MNNVHKKAWLITLPRQVIWLFVILNIIAMFLYPSGTHRDNLSSGYSFTKNFLSDLGRSITFSGEINFLSSLIFNIAMIISGGALSLFYFKVRKVFNEDNIGHYSLSVGEAEFFGSNLWEKILTWTPIILYIGPYMDIMHWYKFDIRAFIPHIALLVIFIIIYLIFKKLFFKKRKG